MITKFRWSVAIILALAIFPAVVSAAPSAGREKDDEEIGAQAPEIGVFVEHCRFSHAAPDDPIVFPGAAGMSHLHDFFGNTTTNANSTFETLRAGGTTCRTIGDASGYWAPALSQNGVVVKPRALTVYYRSGPPGAGTEISAFPPGFRVVAGDANATAPQDRIVSFWSCRGQMLGPSLTPLACAGESGLNLHVRFPQCWDGVNIDSADHKSHMSYLGRGGCPASHPVQVPALTAIVHYPISGDPGQIALSSGGVYSGHADFLNAWDQSVLEQRVASCLNAHVRCNLLNQAKI